MSEDQKTNICLYVTLTFLLTGLTGIGMAIFMFVNENTNQYNFNTISEISTIGYMHEHY